MGESPSPSEIMASQRTDRLAVIRNCGPDAILAAPHRGTAEVVLMPGQEVLMNRHWVFWVSPGCQAKMQTEVRDGADRERVLA